MASSLCASPPLLASIDYTERLSNSSFSPSSPASPNLQCRHSPSPLSSQRDPQQPPQLYCSRRIWSAAVAAFVTASTFPALARDRRNKLDVPLNDYQTSSEGLKYYDLIQGKGASAEKGQTVLVHFDCMYRGIDAVSSRESKILGGNRIIAQPYEFIVGSTPGKERKREFVENANGLFSAQASPKPPPALYSVAEGMRVGGKRRIVVPPELGYGDKGSNEIPPGATFQLDVELLEVKGGATN